MNLPIREIRITGLFKIGRLKDWKIILSHPIADPQVPNYYFLKWSGKKAPEGS